MEDDEATDEGQAGDDQPAPEGPEPERPDEMDVWTNSEDWSDADADGDGQE